MNPEKPDGTTVPTSAPRPVRQPVPASWLGTREEMPTPVGMLIPYSIPTRAQVRARARGIMKERAAANRLKHEKRK